MYEQSSVWLAFGDAALAGDVAVGRSLMGGILLQGHLQVLG